MLRSVLVLSLFLLTSTTAAAQTQTPTPTATPTATPGTRVIDLSGTQAVWFIVALGIGLSVLWFGLAFYDRFSASKRLNRLVKSIERREDDPALSVAQIRALTAAIQKPPPGAHGLTRMTLAFGLLSLVGIVLAALLVSDATVTEDLLKSVVTALVTALVTIIGFYFGARTATDAVTEASATSAPGTAVSATAPGAPTGVTAKAIGTSAEVAFTPPAVTGTSAIDEYRVTSNPGGITALGPASPITVPGLTSGTEYTFTVQAHNASGYGQESDPSPAVTPS
jgi:hypothetical protein